MAGTVQNFNIHVYILQLDTSIDTCICVYNRKLNSCTAGEALSLDLVRFIHFFFRSCQYVSAIKPYLLSLKSL